MAARIAPLAEKRLRPCRNDVFPAFRVMSLFDNAAIPIFAF